MKTRILSLILAVVMIASLTTVMSVCVSADSGDLQVCTDAVLFNGVGHESTSQLSADAWFDQTYGDTVIDEDGSIATFELRGWANPLDGSDLLRYGYTLLSDEIVWDDSIKVPEAGLHGYFPKAERFTVKLNFAYLEAGTYDFRLFCETTTGVYEVQEEAFTFIKKKAAIENVALGKYVYADQSMEAGFFGAQMLTDGQLVPFVEQTDPLGWTAGVGDFFHVQDQEIWVFIELGGKYEVGRVDVYPQLFLDGAGMPSSFTILTGMEMDKDKMTPVASVENINESPADQTTDPTVLTFAPVVCKFVAFRVDRASYLQEADGSYLSEVGEIEVFGKEIPKASYTVTFKAGDTVVATVTYEEGTKALKKADIPEVPAKDGCVGEWPDFKLEDKDIEVKAIYTLVTAADTEAPTDPATEAPTEAPTETPTEAPTEAVTTASTTAGTEAPTDAEKIGKSGCSGVLSASAVLLVLLGGALVLNKRKD